MTVLSFSGLWYGKILSQVSPQRGFKQPCADGEIQDRVAAADVIGLEITFAKTMAGNSNLLGRGRSAGITEQLANLFRRKQEALQTISQVRPAGGQLREMIAKLILSRVLGAGFFLRLGSDIGIRKELIDRMFNRFVVWPVGAAPFHIQRFQRLGVVKFVM